MKVLKSMLGRSEPQAPLAPLAPWSPGVLAAHGSVLVVAERRLRELHGLGLVGEVREVAEVLVDRLLVEHPGREVALAHPEVEVLGACSSPSRLPCSSLSLLLLQLHQAFWAVVVIVAMRLRGVVVVVVVVVW